MKKYIPTILILLIIWLTASAFIAYQGQFISSYLKSRGMLQEEYAYPVDGVLFCITAYAIVILNYAFLLLSPFSIRHPFISFLLFSIIPVSFTCISFLGAMHASSYWDALIIVMLFTFFLHFLLLPFLLPLHRKYIYLRRETNRSSRQY